MPSTRLEQVLHAYLDALSERPDLTDERTLLEQEFMRVAAAMARFGYSPRDDLLGGDAGVELLDATCAVLLSGELSGALDADAFRRLVGRIGYALFRRSRRWFRGEIDATTPAPPSPEPARMHATAFDRLVEQVQDPNCRKRRGGIHLGRVAEALDMPRRAVRRQVRGLIRGLGRDQESDDFWRCRLGECLLEILREQVEVLAPDLLPSARVRGAGVQRLRRLLPRLAHVDARGGPLAEVRHMARREMFPWDRLRAAALELSGDPFPVLLAEAELLRARGETLAALDVLAEARSGPDPRPGCLPPASRRPILLALARARCLERCGDPGRASDVLEPVASLQRRNPLLVYNRFVLAEAAGVRERAREAQRDLLALPVDATLAARLRQGILDCQRRAVG